MALRPLNLRITANTDGLDRGLKDSVRNLDGFKKRTQETMVSVARATTVAVTAFAALGGGILAAANQAAQAGTEIRNLSAIAGTGTTQFQKYAAASRTIGIEQEKLADIFKDVNDKFGDYMATGAGPLADFFENIAPKIGVTADQFARLSGPEALQLYVTSLERAGVSQQQMTFYMEALASDATALVPLLMNGGQAMRELGDEAERAGRVLSEEMIANAVELDRELANLAATLKTQATTAVLEHKEELIAIANFITDTVIPAFASLVSFIGEGVKGWQELGRAANLAGQYMANALEIQSRSNLVGGTGPGVGDLPSIDDYLSRNAPSGDVSGGMDPTGELNAYLNRVDAETPEPLVYSGRGSVAGPNAEDVLQAYIDNQKALFLARQEANAEIEEEEIRHGGRLAEIVDQSEAEAQRIRDHYAQMEMNMRKQTVNGAIGLLQQFGQENKAFAKAAVILNAAQRVSEISANTAAASTRALAELGPIAGPPAAARIAAFGAAQKAIAAASAVMSLGGGRGGGGGAGGGSIGGVGAAADQAPQAPTPTQNRSLTLVGDSFNRQQAIQIAEFMNEGTDNGLVIRGRR